jgi:hypothetical protein
METVERARRWVFGLSFALFALACALPALEIRHVPNYFDLPAQVEEKRGIILLIGGVLAPLVGVWAGLANLTLAFCWVALLRRRWRLALLWSALTLLAAADLLRVSRGSVRIGVPLRGSVENFIEQPLIGCYLWLGSMVVAGGGALLCWHLDRRQRREHGKAEVGTIGLWRNLR